MESNKGVLEKWFHLKENHTDAKTEVIAGITTFMTMAYILAVNPNVLGAIIIPAAYTANFFIIFVSFFSSLANFETIYLISSGF